MARRVWFTTKGGRGWELTTTPPTEFGEAVELATTHNYGWTARDYTLPTSGPSLDFGLADNSQYVPLI